MAPSSTVEGLPIWVLDSFLPAHEHAHTYLYCGKSLYSPEHSSSPNPEERYSRLVATLTTDQILDNPLTAKFSEVATELNYPAGIQRAYINLASPDTNFVEHFDDRARSLTMVYYPNVKWDVSWAGETLFFNSQREISFASIYKPNRALFFDSRILHSARSPSNLAPAFRYTIAYKGTTTNES